MVPSTTGGKMRGHRAKTGKIRERDAGDENGADSPPGHGPTGDHRRNRVRYAARHHQQPRAEAKGLHEAAEAVG